MRVFAGTVGRPFAQDLCAHLGVPLGDASIRLFANDCLEVQLPSDCAGDDVFLVQPIVAPVHDALMELLLMVDAAAAASAARVSVVLPHFAYARSDKRGDVPNSVGGRLVADLLKTAGVDRVLTMTLHSSQAFAFFRMPTVELAALELIAGHVARGDLSNLTVVSPDLGGAKRANTLAGLLGVPVAAGTKERYGTDRVWIGAVIGEIAGRDVLVLDDEIANGSTIDAIVDRLADAGAASIRVACTHGIFANGALERLADDARISEIITTDTVPRHADADGLTVLSVVPLFAEAIADLAEVPTRP